MPPYNGTNRVWYSSDGGYTWSDYSKGLTPLPVNTIVYEKGSNDGLYVGTDVGVFYTNKKLYQTDGWVCFSENLPVCIVTDLEINDATNTIRAATFGRGIWKSHLAYPSDEDITHTGTITPDFYEAKNNIYSNAILQPGTTVYHAGNEIVFTDGFVASAYDGVNFHAFIHPCDAPGNSFRLMQPSADTTTVSESDTLFIKEPETENKIISIFPNPNTGNFTLQTNTEKSITFYVYNCLGQLLYKSENINNQNNYFVDISDYGKGIYFIKIFAEDKIYTEKIIYQ